MSRATILHVDLDAFFASVEQRDRPELRGRPVVVGGGGPADRGVVSAASYEARRFGIRSAMPLRTAAALCPEAVFVPVDGRKYAAVSGRVMGILGRFSPLVEPISIDEAFLDVAGTRSLLGSPEDVARAIKAAIRTELSLTASVGIASTKLVAKVASDLRKPDGLVVVPEGQEAAFLAPLPIARLWGVGDRTAAVLAEYGATTIGDLAGLPEDLLRRRLGRQGSLLSQRARGIDPSPVAGGHAVKSISHEHTFDVDTSDLELIESTLLALAEGVAARLRASGLRAGSVTIKIRDADFHTVVRQATLVDTSDQADAIWRTSLRLARPELRGIRVRLLGVAATRLGQAEQLGLFEPSHERGQRVTAATDAIRQRFGPRALVRARLLGTPVPEPFERDPMRPPDTAQAPGTRDHPPVED